MTSFLFFSRNLFYCFLLLCLVSVCLPWWLCTMLSSQKRIIHSIIYIFFGSDQQQLFYLVTICMKSLSLSVFCCSFSLSLSSCMHTNTRKFAYLPLLIHAHFKIIGKINDKFSRVDKAHMHRGSEREREIENSTFFLSMMRKFPGTNASVNELNETREDVYRAKTCEWVSRLLRFSLCQN